jgi:hydroxymethylpyrimidine pyrophosphatase-like HAD family hydrolase
MLKSLTQGKSTDFKKIRLIASDMDGTLTTNGKFTPKLLQTFEQLNAAGIKVLIVTGRSSGWVSGLSYYLPVEGAIAENGGLFYPSISKLTGESSSERPFFLTPIPDLMIHRQNLEVTFAQLKLKFPKIKESSDNIFRLTDWTFDVEGLSQLELRTLAHLCHEMGWDFTYSTVQCHIKPQGQDKAVGLWEVLWNFFPGLSPDEVITVGDSPNDESLFDQRYFPLSVGVANIQEYVDSINHKPKYITNAPEGKGFCELAHYVLNM